MKGCTQVAGGCWVLRTNQIPAQRAARRTVMRCNHCHSTMQQTDSIAEGNARQTWYRCPVCTASQTVSQPEQATLRRIGNFLRCSCDWPAAAIRYRGTY